MRERTLLIAAALLGATGVALGAFGAHALAEHVRPERLATFETAVRYQLVHAVALLALAGGSRDRPRLARAGAPLLAGVLVFSGSLYALVASDVGAFGAIAPVGGVLLVVGWCLIAWQAVRGTET
ncbi:DUF423 domain-containing protein [soil metagenome]|nr:DUF423 domain-containing protein [Trueperaceae bacterium]